MIVHSREEAVQALEELEKMGTASRKLVIEEYPGRGRGNGYGFVSGETVRPGSGLKTTREVSMMETGGQIQEEWVLQSHRLENPALEKQIYQDIFVPSGSALVEEGRSFQGILYGA